MSNNTQATSEPTQESVVNNPVNSRAELLALRAKRFAAAEPEQEKVEESEEEVVETTSEETSEAEAEQKTGEDKESSVLSQIDFESLTEEQLAEIAELTQRGAGRELSKLRKEKRELEEKLEELEGSLDGTLAKVNPTSEQFANISSVDEAEKQLAQWTRELEAYQGLIDEGWDLNDEGDKGLEIQGRWFSKEAILQHRNHIRGTIKGVSERKTYLERSSNADEGKFEEAKESISWLSDTDSSEFKQWKKLASAGDLKLLEKLSPELAANYKAFSAYYVNGNNAPRRTKVKLPVVKKKEPGSVPDSGKPSRGGSGDKIGQLKAKMAEASNPKERQKLYNQIKQLRYS